MLKFRQGLIQFFSKMFVNKCFKSVLMPVGRIACRCWESLVGVEMPTGEVSEVG